ncbi:MAG: AbrB/MazE/SpoVT family DNA-binding domain-containing protein [Candidatus Aenigmarchaeota archaeon]|nr:AbrB/MazE/SpoVT family DNA-binding domain-containing protein [Candidatus Aenigmarchaeota archaeon]
MIEKEKCPKCEKGRLHKMFDEAEPGIRVEAFKCNKCNEVWYSQEIMEKIEAMQKGKAEERRIVKVGNSLAAIIPSKIAKKLNLKEKEKIYVEEQNGQVCIRASKL